MLKEMITMLQNVNLKQTNYVTNRHSKFPRNPWTLLWSIDLSVLFFSYHLPTDSEPHSYVRLTMEAAGVNSNDLPGRSAFFVARFVKLCHDT